MPFRISEPGPQLRSVPHYAGDSETGSFLAVALPGERLSEDEGAAAVLAVDSPHPGRFAEGAEDVLALHAVEVAERLRLGRLLEQWERERAAARELPRAVSRVTAVEGVAATAERLLDEARALTGAMAGAVLWFEDRGPDGKPGPAAQRGRGPVLLAAEGLGLRPGHRLDAGEESWATWAGQHPDQPVLLPAFHADRGMPRIGRGDELDASWSYAAQALAGGGALALAWPERQLPGGPLLEAARVLAAAGGAALVREEALAGLAAGRDLDGLTGLPGRSAFLERARELLAAEEPGPRRLGLATFDVDGSTRLLEEAGPRAWDAAIETTAKTLRAALPASAELFRWGGDEFVALLPGAGDEGVRVATRRAVAAAAQAQAGGRSLRVSAGHASHRAGREGLEELLARVAQALDDARHRGGGTAVAAADPAR
jgi:diguanylate cyclase (GGDEF)-like protein